MESTHPTPSLDDRLLAGIAHGSILFMGWGLIVPLIIYTVQRNKSKYVTFQALQALGYQVGFAILSLGLSFIVSLIALLGVTIGSSVSAAAQTEAGLVISMLVELFLFAALFGVLGLFVLLGLAAAAACLFGVDFKYPLYGAWLQRYLNPLKKPAPRSVEVAHA